jgi:hypothetical protein
MILLRKTCARLQNFEARGHVKMARILTEPFAPEPAIESKHEGDPDALSQSKH